MPIPVSRRTEVYEARHAHIGSRAAIKVLLPQIFDVGYLPGGNAYIVMWARDGGMTFRAVRGLPLGTPEPARLPAEGAAFRRPLCATGPCPASTARSLQFVGFRCARMVR